MTGLISDIVERNRRRRVAIKLHEIEANPFTREDKEMFEMFDRENFTNEQRIAYIREKAIARTKEPQAAE